jgi:hypothetical protein
MAVVSDEKIFSYVSQSEIALSNDSRIGCRIGMK